MKKILLIDGDENIRYLYGLSLGFQGVDVISAKDTETAQVQMKGDLADLLIIDYSQIEPVEPKGLGVIDSLKAFLGHKYSIILISNLPENVVKTKIDGLKVEAFFNRYETSMGQVITGVRKVLGVKNAGK